MSRYKKILLIDDSSIDNFVCKKFMEKINFAEEIVVQISGKAGLGYLNKCISEKLPPPQIIFLDIRMPEMNGFEFLVEFKKLDAKFISKIKVIILSSSLDVNDMKRAKNDPAIVKFLNKPLKKEMLEEIHI